MSDDSLLDALQNAISEAIWGPEETNREAASASVDDAATSTAGDMEAGTTPTQGALAAAEANALGEGHILLFTSSMGGVGSERRVAFELSSADPPDDLAASSSARFRFDDFQQLFADSLALYHALSGRSDWKAVAIEELGWTIWLKAPWPPTEAVADEETAEAIRTLTGNRKLLEAAQERGSPNEALHTALDVVSAATSFFPSPAMQAVGAGADTANMILYVEEGDEVMATASAVSLFMIGGINAKAVTDGAGAIVGYKVSKSEVSRLGVIGILRRIRAARMSLRLPRQIVDEILEFGMYDNLLLREEDLLIEVLERGGTDNALLAVLEANAGLVDLGFCVNARAVVWAKEELSLARTLLEEGAHIENLDELFFTWRAVNESVIVGGKFALRYVHAHRGTIRGIEQVLVRDSGATYQGVDVILNTGVVELKAYQAKNLTSAKAESFAKQIERRLQQAQGYDDGSGLITITPAFKNVELVFSSERLGASALPEAFEKAMLQKIADLETKYSSIGAKITVTLWP